MYGTGRPPTGFKELVLRLGQIPLRDQADLVSPALVAKTFRYPFWRKSVLYRRHPVPHEGRIAIVTDVGHGMRWTRQRA